METNIHFPSDATLLWDAVRTITRLMQEVHEKLPRGVPGFTNRSRSARRRMQEIQRMSAQQRQTSKCPSIANFSASPNRWCKTRAALKKVKRVQARGKVPGMDSVALDQLSKEIRGYCGLADRVIDQTRRRVIEGEQVPSEEKIYSIFEAHTDLVKRGKEQKPVEFGHKVFLAESVQGLVADHEVLRGNPSNTNRVEASLERHQHTFAHAPDLYAADRGFFSAENEATCKKAGVSQVCIGGNKTTERDAQERTPAFKKGQRFRAGIEGRISVVFRGRGMKRCLAKGEQRFEILVGAAVLANNLLRIAELLRTKKTESRRATT